MDLCSTMNELFPNFSIVAVYNLGEYDAHMHLLYHDIKTLIDNKFNGAPVKFQPDERLIFLLDDLDFFLTNDSPGFTLYNLQLILRELDIPNYFCTVISNIPNYKNYTTAAQRMLTTEEIDINPISSLYFSICLTPLAPAVNLNFDDIEAPFIILSRQQRFHRTFFMSKIFNLGLQNKGLISYSNINDCAPHHNINRASDVKLNLSNSLLTPIPFNKNNCNYVLLKNHANRQLVAEFRESVDNFKNLNEQIDIAERSVVSAYDNSPVQRGLLYVALETTVMYPEVFLSGISFKGIVKKRPFVILGVPGTIRYLQQLGFKTFNEFWDESYDQINDFESRVEAILDIVQHISELSPDDLADLANNMSDILDYNFNHFCTSFSESEKENLLKSMR